MVEIELVKKDILLSVIITLLIALLSACGSSQGEGSDAKTSVETIEQSSEPSAVPSATVEAESSSMVHESEEIDSVWRTRLKSGMYTMLEPDSGAATEYGIDFDFEVMTYWSGFPKLNNSNYRTGPLAFKDDSLYAIRQGVNELAVFDIWDDHTLVYSAERSVKLAIDHSKAPLALDRDTVFVLPETAQAGSASPVVSSASAAEPSASDKSDEEWLQTLKSGNYVLQEEKEGSDKLFFRFRFEEMLFSASYLRYEERDNIMGAFAIKDGLLYAISYEAFQLFVFEIRDEYTLIYSAERSNAAANSYNAIEDGAVFTLNDNPWETYTYSPS